MWHFPQLSLLGAWMRSPSVNKKNKDFKEELTQVKSTLQFCNKVGAKSRSENFQQLGEGREKWSPFHAHVTVMIHNGNLGQNLQLGKHQEKITFIIKHVLNYSLELELGVNCRAGRGSKLICWLLKPSYSEICPLLF